MKEDPDDRLKALFLAACELSPREQEAFLNIACGDDETLLMQSGRPVGVFLHKPLFVRAPDRFALQSPGHPCPRIFDYT